MPNGTEGTKSPASAKVLLTLSKLSLSAEGRREEELHPVLFGAVDSCDVTPRVCGAHVESRDVTSGNERWVRAALVTSRHISSHIVVGRIPADVADIEND